MSLRKIRVTLTVEIDEAWRASDRLQVYTDFGDGSIDTTKPLLSRSLETFPDDIRQTVHHEGYGDEPYGDVPYGGAEAVSSGPHGYGDDPYGDVEYGGALRHVEVDVLVPQAHGTWKFAVKAIDGAGNAQGALQEFTLFVSGTDPEPVASFAFDSYDSGDDVVTFDVTL
jgi:hypothetical protein